MTTPHREMVELLDEPKAVPAEGCASQDAAPEPDLSDLLAEARAAGSGSPIHDLSMVLVAGLADRPTPGRFDFILNDTFVAVSGMVEENCFRRVGVGATWVRFVDPKRNSGLLAVLQTPIPAPGTAAEGDLILVGHRGMLTRGVIRHLCNWAFVLLGFRRVVVRFPVGCTVLADLARRAGFEPDGRARDFFADNIDASVWSMTARRCRWLPGKPPSPTDRVEHAMVVSTEMH